MATLPLPVHSYRLRSEQASPARLVNCYAEALPPDAKTPMILTRAPGIRPFAEVGTGPIRGVHEFDGDLFVVSGSQLYRLASDGTVTGILSTAIPGSGPVSMAHNTQFLVIVTNPQAFYSDGFGVYEITDTDFTSRGAKYVKFCDNYMVFTEPNTGRFFWANVGSVTNFDALSFVTAEANPDLIIGIEVDHQQVLPFGQRSVQIFRTTDNGFEAVINGLVEIGCLNGDTVAKLDNSVFWVAHDFTVRRLNGATPVRVSQHAVEQFLSTVDVESLRAYSYNQDGHFFYVLTCSTGCYVYDVTSGEWHERATYPYDYFRWQCCDYAHGRHYVGDFNTNEIGYFDQTYYKDGDGIQRMEWTHQPIYAENKKAKHHRLEVVLETGVGLTTGQGSDPEMMLAYSDDAGKTWVNLPNKKIGKLGEYRKRVWWTGLGSTAQRVYRGAVSDPVRINLADAQLDATGARV